MKLIYKIFRVLRHLYSLIKTLFKSHKVIWQNLTSKAINCQISDKAKIWDTYNLSDTTIDDYTYINSNATISFTKIGKYCSIGPNLLCGWGIHPLDGLSTSPLFYSTKTPFSFTYSNSDKVLERKEINIGNDVFIGANVTILDGIAIGDGAVIGAGSVVSKDIPPYAVAAGCPIKVIRYRFTPDIIETLLETQWWNKDDKILRELELHFFDVNKFLLNFK